MTFPTPYTVGHHARVAGGLDSYRDPDTFTPAKGDLGTPHPAYGWAAPQSSEPKIVGHDRTVVEVELYCPADFNPGPGDLIDLPTGKQYVVIGEPEDHNHGFHEWQPGNVINLRRVEG